MELIAVRPTPPVGAALEKTPADIKDDQLVEVTPKSIRSRKALFHRNERKRTFRAKESAFVSATAS
jgi:GTP-binding protein